MAILAFSDSKEHGAFPITDEQGQLVASTTHGGFTIKFDSTDATGNPLASGHKHALGPFEAQDAQGTVIVLMQGPRTHTEVQLPARGLSGVLAAPRIGKEWQFTTTDGRVLLNSVPHEDAGLFANRDAWLVRTNGTLSLPELVAVVELHRLKVKADRQT